MHKRGYSRHAGVRLSVRLSVSLSRPWIMTKTNKHVLKIFSPSGSHTAITPESC